MNRPGEKIYDVAWSDNRKHDPATGKLPPVGNTVDVKTATYTNDIGSTQLSVVWTDPDFDPSQRAVYYVRTLEIPTPRWSTHDAVKLGVAPPTLVPATLQERFDDTSLPHVGRGLEYIQGGSPIRDDLDPPVADYYRISHCDLCGESIVSGLGRDV